MNLNSLKYFTVLLLTICFLSATSSYGQETVRIKTLSTKTTNTRLKLKTEKKFSVLNFCIEPNKGNLQKYYIQNDYNTLSLGVGFTKAYQLRNWTALKKMDKKLRVIV